MQVERHHADLLELLFTHKVPSLKAQDVKKLLELLIQQVCLVVKVAM
jgi:hypothetical protein